MRTVLCDIKKRTMEGHLASAVVGLLLIARLVFADTSTPVVKVALGSVERQTQVIRRPVRNQDNYNHCFVILALCC